MYMSHKRYSSSLRESTVESPPAPLTAGDGGAAEIGGEPADGVAYGKGGLHTDPGEVCVAADDVAALTDGVDANPREVCVLTVG